MGKKVEHPLDILREELQQTNVALKCAYDKFNYVTEPELIEASIYEISALKARYSYLLRCIKEQEPAARSGGFSPSGDPDGDPPNQGKGRVSSCENLSFGILRRGGLRREGRACMSGIEIGALCVVGAFLLFAAVRLFRGPVKLALRVLVNSALGFGAVWLLNLPAALTGIRLGLNVFNALFIGVLGVPGFGLLLLLQWVLA